MVLDLDGTMRQMAQDYFSKIEMTH